jgi:hypothetical protein
VPFDRASTLRLYQVVSRAGDTVTPAKFLDAVSIEIVLALGLSAPSVSIGLAMSERSQHRPMAGVI